MKLEKFLQENYNYNPEIKDAVKGYFKQWKSWYVGNVKNFHNYFIYNGRNKVNQKRFTMNMAKEISEDWSDILWSEKCKISMADEKSQEQFDDLVNELDLYALINQSIEQSGALGTIGTVVSVYDIKQNEDTMILDVSDAKTRVDVVDFEWIYPLTWTNKEITECAFGSVEYINGQKCIVLSVHKKADNGNYVIYNHLFKETNGNLTEIVNNESTMAEFDTKSDVKWFSIFKPLLTNNLFNNSPFGIPHFANAIDNLKAVDISFDALKNEVKDGRRRTFVRSDMLSYEDGSQKMVFDPEDTTVYVLPDGTTKDDLIQNDSSELRTEKQIGTLNTNLNILGSKVGFGENHYHYDGTNLSTATAVVSSNSKLFRRKKKLEVGYESSIYDLVMAICYASSEFGTYNINTEDMVIQFDDSIIEDKEVESNRAMREVQLGLISKVEYRMQVKGETKEIAEQAIKEIQENEPSLNELIGE
jgi:A118 family predicted phage portal protein